MLGSPPLYAVGKISDSRAQMKMSLTKRAPLTKKKIDIGRNEGHVPPKAAAPNSSAALFRSDWSCLSLSLRALSLGSRTSSESYSASSSPSISPAAFLRAFSASFSASFCLSVPFFLGGATTGLASSSSSSEDSSQSDYMHGRE